MSAPLSVAARGRDLRIEVTDSCNCCCCIPMRKAPAPTTPVYINSIGEVVRFDPRKADDERVALRRCVSNLQRHIEALASEAKRDKAELQAEIERRIGVTLAEESPPDVTLSLAMRINSAIKEIFE